MKQREIRTVWLAACLAVPYAAAAVADDSGAKLTLAAGAEFTSGTYGGDVDIEDIYVPVSATVDFGSVAFRLTVPYLSVDAPEGTVFDADGQPVSGTGAMTTVSGLGDVIGSVTFFDVLNSPTYGFAMDLTAKVKFGTAAEEDGLGTGENDYTVQADVYKFVDRFTWLGSLGYKYRGDPAGIDLDDGLMASVGATYRLTPDARTGLFFDYRESAIAGNDSIRELSGFVSRRLGEQWKIQVYALAGLTDSSPDWGAGVRVKKIM